MSHTLGPWVVLDKSSDKVVDSHGNCVALPDGKDSRECYANACLIAAAPDLLEACREAVAKWPIGDKDLPDVARRNPTVAREQYRAPLYALRAAIARAEGREVTA